jgi:hypothetical protein
MNLIRFFILGKSASKTRWPDWPLTSTTTFINELYYERNIKLSKHLELWFSKQSDHVFKPLGGSSSFKALFAVNAAKGVP